MKNLIIRILIGASFLLAILCGAVAIGSAWGLHEINNVDMSDAAIIENCKEAVKAGERDNVNECWFDTARAGVGLGGLALYALIIFGPMTVILLTFSIRSLRKHTKRLRAEKAGSS